MGRPDSRYLSDRSSGERLYVSDDKEYSEQMGVGAYRRRAAFIQNDELYKQSEFKKPYREDDYPEMEYTFDALPGFPIDWDYDTQHTPGINNIDGYNPWDVKFLCTTGACYGIDKEECGDIKCGWPIIGLEIVDLPNPSCTLKISGAEICASCPKDTHGSIVFNVVMKAVFKHNGATVTVIGRHFTKSISSCGEDDEDPGPGPCDPDTTPISWDSDNSADEIDQNDTAVVTVLGSGSPFSWGITGSGFEISGTENSATVTTAVDACGAGSITCTDCDGNQATGTILCTTGTWVQQSHCQAFGSAGGACNNETITDDVKEYNVFVGTVYGPPFCTCNNEHCENKTQCYIQTVWNWGCA